MKFLPSSPAGSTTWHTDESKESGSTRKEADPGRARLVAVSLLFLPLRLLLYILLLLLLFLLFDVCLVCCFCCFCWGGQSWGEESEGEAMQNRLKRLAINWQKR